MVSAIEKFYANLWKRFIWIFHLSSYKVRQSDHFTPHGSCPPPILAGRLGLFWNLPSRGMEEISKKLGSILVYFPRDLLLGVGGPSLCIERQIDNKERNNQSQLVITPSFYRAHIPSYWCKFECLIMWADFFSFCEENWFLAKTHDLLTVIILSKRPSTSKNTLGNSMPKMYTLGKKLCSL